MKRFLFLASILICAALQSNADSVTLPDTSDGCGLIGDMVDEHAYTVVLPDDYTIDIDGSTYTNGDVYTSMGSVTRDKISAPTSEDEFAITVIDDAQATITVLLASLPEQPACAPYTQAVLYPHQQDAVGVTKVQWENNVYTLSNNVLAASFIKIDNALFFAGSEAMDLVAGTELFSVAFGNGDKVYASAMNLKGVELQELQANPEAIGGVEHFAGKQLVAHYDYTYKGAAINIVWRAVLRDGSHYLRTEMELEGVNDVDMFNVVPLMYTVDVIAAESEPQVVGNTRGAVLISDKIFAGLEHPVAYNTVGESTGGVVVEGEIDIQGCWSRNITLQQGETWKISGVVGLVAQDGTQALPDIHKTQKRRSFLAYSERERAVPWRPNPVYISWYELNIDRNNAAEPSENMNANQVLDVLRHWKTDFYDKYGVAPNSFVIDDGWDNYGTWTFHANFPNEMRDMAALAKEMGAGIGAWLGPVGGYGVSGEYRRAYWKERGGMQLSNPDYYQVFLNAAYNLTQNQGNFNFFKFDGISAQFSAVGPDAGDLGNENAEGIIRLERYVREVLRKDIFLNTTVGTWASPFWYQITDATWRQENDYGEAGENSIDRERWITYRDRLVYQNYVTHSPICPINTLMTHGFILTRFGDVSKNMDYEPARRELRCAFVCGSGMVELYNDYELMNSINDGKLWADLAECIKWQKRNADVLADIHWVGGNPWTGSTTEVYGWAAWNNEKSTLALRNGNNNAKSYTFTLRDALNIPAHVKGSIVLTKSFEEQEALQGLTEGEPINIDTQLSVILSGSSLYSFEGKTSK